MKPRLVFTFFCSGLAAVLAGALGVAPAAAAAKGLHVVPSPVINNSCLSGAAVIAPNDVWAVGDQAQGSSFNTLIEHWDGTSWAVTPSPKLPQGSALTGVTAPAPDNAWAVGFDGGSADALVEHWDGTSWSVVASPAFAGVSISNGAISADSATDVWAVGFLASSSTTSENVSLHWDGTRWAVVPSPNPNPQGNNGLGAVAAVSATDVWAAGEQLKGPFTEHWDGSKWTILATPAGVRFFAAMAASTGGTVLAVGQGTNQSGIILSN